MSSSTYLCLDGLTPKVQVLAGVHLAILDHFARRNEKESKVIGLLLGHNLGTQIEVTNSCVMPYAILKDEVVVDFEYQGDVVKLHQLADMKEEVVGWYSTGSKHDPMFNFIHERYQKDSHHPIVHLLVDTNPSCKVHLSAFISEPLGVRAKDGPREASKGDLLFVPISCRVLSYEPEKIALESLRQTFENPVAPNVHVPSEFDNLIKAVDNLHKLIHRVIEYVDSVIAGKTKGDEAIGRFLLDTVAAVPKIDTKQFEKMFNSTLQDMLMVAYLANLTRAQVILQEKITRFLADKS